MAVPREIVEQFVDAAVLDVQRADELLCQYPELRSATWLGESILRFLAIENFSDGVRYLARQGWDIDEIDRWGNTSLIDSVMAKAHHSVKALLELGANPNVVSQLYENALSMAIFSKDIEMVRLLLDSGVDPNSANATNKSAIDETISDLLQDDSDDNARIRALLVERGYVEP